MYTLPPSTIGCASTLPKHCCHCMNSPLSLYILAVQTAINNEDGLAFRFAITISPGVPEGAARAAFAEPLEFDLYPLPEKFRPVVRLYLKLMRSVYILNDIDASFDDLNEMVAALNRAADLQANWINPALINAVTELINVYQVKQKTKPDAEPSADFEDTLGAASAPRLSLERLATTVNNAFKLLLNDKNLDLAQLKRTDIYFFLGSLIRIYFQLGKLELAKSVEKALRGTRFDLPPLNARDPRKKKYAVTYLYYSAVLSLDDADFKEAEAKLTNALEIMAYYSQPLLVAPHTERVLMLLIPLRLHNAGAVPAEKTWQRFPRLKLVYGGIVGAIARGDIKLFEMEQAKFEVVFLKRHLYLLVEHLKARCYAGLSRRVARAFAQLQLDADAHIVPLSAFQVGLELSTNWKRRGDAYEPLKETLSHLLDELECILANLIYSGYMKGYILHGNKCVVLSKTNAFPQK